MAELSHTHELPNGKQLEHAHPNPREVHEIPEMPGWYSHQPEGGFPMLDKMLREPSSGPSGTGD